MKMNKKGFTLIELLAVIVILGLLMAIAIPSVTKYITQSRKKTLMNTVSNYMSALTNEVNNMDYTFTDSTKVYAVPVECIALERGGTNPFGAWYPASTIAAGAAASTATFNSQWAYVLVYYDDTTSSYTYGFTFKDSAGYGLYPMASTKMKEKGDDVTTSAGSALNTNKAAIQPAWENSARKYVKASAYYGTWAGFNWSDSIADTNSDGKITEADITLQVLVGVDSGADGLTTCNIAQTN
jgi:prepilin-type N-terminal cleavage/methylation domain-containing protein